MKSKLLPIIGVLATTSSLAAEATKPNIIFVFADQWRKQALGFKGEDPVLTPNLDKFASWAFSFDNATSTRPVSGPNRACLLTGLYPNNSGVFANSVPLDYDEQTLGDVCHNAGYRTAMIGKWHLNGIDDHVSDPAGRHNFEHWVQSIGHVPFNQRYYINDDPEVKYVREYWAPSFETDEAIKFIDEHKEEPFCVVLSYNPPHTSGGLKFEDRWQPGKRNNGEIKYGYGYGGPKEYEDLYKDVDYDKNPIRANVQQIPVSNRNGVDIYDDSGFCVPGYFGAITAIDNDFGNLMTYLEKNNLLENTIVVFTADHGESMGSQGKMTKGTWFEESVGIPALIGWKGKTVNAREKGVFNSIDFMPTLYGLMGLDAPEMDGTDYSPRLLGKRFNAPKYSFQSFDFGGVAELKNPRYWRSVTTERYVLTLCGMNKNRSYTKDGLVLYDLKKDPYQMNPIGRGEGSDKIIDELFAVLKDHLDKLGDPFIEAYWNNEKSGFPKLNKYTLDLTAPLPQKSKGTTSAKKGNNKKKK